ncbi:MAG: AAA family ATPase, partial [Pseudorhodoplanes sp.]|nr:AAA family ATPase [Pseudorhodoplanes sp.]
MTGDVEALRNVDFNWVRPLESVWSDAAATTDGREVLVDKLVAKFLVETGQPNKQAQGQAVLGPAGIGKTHLVGNLRCKVWSSGGWFVLLDVVGLTDFWRSAALSFLTSLLQEMPDGRRQFEVVIAGVARRFKCEREVERAFQIPNIDARKIADLLLTALVRIDQKSALRYQDFFRALCLLRSSELSAMSLAHTWLQGYDADESLRKAVGIVTPPPSPVDLVKGMSWVMSLAGPTLVAVDQIDGVVNPSALSVSNDDLGNIQTLGDVLAAGLLDLHNVQYRAQTIITCLFESWKILEERGPKPFRDRFDEPIAMQGLSEVATVQALIMDRLRSAYQAASFVPPFPSWPFSENALASAASVAMTPRTILMRCDAFRRACLEKGQVEVCENLLVEKPDVTAAVLTSGPFDSSYLHFRQTADVGSLITAGDDDLFGRLLREVFDLYTQQIDPDESIDVVSKGDPAQRIPPLHGRLTFTYHNENDREQHFCFRALEHSHHISFQARLRAALTASGISHQIPDRHLLLVRRSSVPGGQKTAQLFNAFKTAGGIVIDPSDEDLRSFVALQAIRDQAAAGNKQAEFEAWLRKSKPLLDTSFFKAAGLSPPPLTSDPRTGGSAPAKAKET